MSLEELDFEPVCDVCDCDNPAVWIARPGLHRLTQHDKQYIITNLLCDDCKAQMERRGSWTCDTCKKAGRQTPLLPLSQFYSSFDKLEGATNG